MVFNCRVLSLCMANIKSLQVLVMDIKPGLLGAMRASEVRFRDVQSRIN